jgi:hypothetical protein
MPFEFEDYDEENDPLQEDLDNETDEQIAKKRKKGD